MLDLLQKSTGMGRHRIAPDSVLFLQKEKYTRAKVNKNEGIAQSSNLMILRHPHIPETYSKKSTGLIGCPSFLISKYTLLPSTL